MAQFFSGSPRGRDSTSMLGKKREKNGREREKKRERKREPAIPIGNFNT